MAARWQAIWACRGRIIESYGPCMLQSAPSRRVCSGSSLCITALASHSASSASKGVLITLLCRLPSAVRAANLTTVAGMPPGMPPGMPVFSRRHIVCLNVRHADSSCLDQHEWLCTDSIRCYDQHSECSTAPSHKLLSKNTLGKSLIPIHHSSRSPPPNTRPKHQQ